MNKIKSISKILSILIIGVIGVQTISILHNIILLSEAFYERNDTGIPHHLHSND